MAKPRGTYPPEFKLRAVAMMTDQGLSVAEVARQLGVSESCLHEWKKAVRQNGKFRPLTPVAPYPAAETREGLVPYLSAEVQRVGNRWDVWFDHKHVGGIRTAEPATGRLRLRTDGRAVRVERVELERVHPAE